VPVYVLPTKSTSGLLVQPKVQSQSRRTLLARPAQDRDRSQSRHGRTHGELEIGTLALKTTRVPGKAGALGRASLVKCSVPFRLSTCLGSKPTSVPVAAIAFNFP